MKKSKIIFLVVALSFVVAVVFFIVDFSRRTTFPGNKPAQEEVDSLDNQRKNQ